ncbi:NAD-dependent epimerase/dehydratase family protein [Mesorhizobium sp.]|uniref:NAD-dependent epimerase/dehydratase family protein n=1 Tax=Mesorhizobium sp. TaxID=1871066 RepID=UPI0025BA73DD|nr:NAD-dependent epimerase/dehydratase family protein [Mesorhizobium sp.]
MTSNRPILITGAAGFIGFHLCRRLLADGRQVVGLDSMNGYYDINLKRARLEQLEAFPHFRFEHIDLTDRNRFPRCSSPLLPRSQSISQLKPAFAIR